jgi:polyhydroxybutyrate depolymerase
MALVVGGLIALNAFSRGQSQTETFTIDGKERRAVVFASSAPLAGRGAPVVFVFHGHGGNAQNAARRFRVHELWREAVVVYMQGEPGAKGITDPEGKLNGWQKNSGELGDRDIMFFDAALERIQKKYAIDPNRVYVLGHSNGGRFVNLLWNMRGDKIAALCSAAGPGGQLIQSAKPKSVFIIAGERDQLVPFQAQQWSIELARKLLKTDSSKAKVEGLLRTEPGVNGTELVTYIHPGGHLFPEQAMPAVISFFNRHTRQS